MCIAQIRKLAEQTSRRLVALEDNSDFRKLAPPSASPMRPIVAREASSAVAPDGDNSSADGSFLALYSLFFCVLGAFHQCTLYRYIYI